MNMWLINRHNPTVIVAKNKVVSLYPHVLCHRSSDKRPYKIHLIVGTDEDPGYEVWSFENIVQWKAALMDLGVGEIWDELLQIAKDAGRQEV